MRGLAHLAALVCFQPAASRGRVKVAFLSPDPEPLFSLSAAARNGKMRKMKQQPSEQTNSENDS